MKKTSVGKRTRHIRKFDPEYYVTVYEQARAGSKLPKIARILKIKVATLKTWLTVDLTLKSALRRGRAASAAGETLAGHIYGRLDPSAKRIWTELTRESGGDDDEAPEVRAERLLAGTNRALRQQLFLHSLVSCNFIVSEACRRVGIPDSTVKLWLREDPDFVTLVNGVQEVKKDFVEGALFDLIQQRDSGAVVFAAKTLLKDRGYDNKTEHVHSGTVTHAHVSLDKVVELMSPAAGREFLEAYRAVKAKLAGDQGPRQVQALPAHGED